MQQHISSSSSSSSSPSPIEDIFPPNPKDEPSPDNEKEIERLHLLPGCILLENPPRTWRLCHDQGMKTWYSTILRSAQAKLFSISTGDDYQHVLQYIGDNKVLHTRNGKVGVDHISEFAPHFVSGCGVLWPRLDILVPLVIERYPERFARSETNENKEEESEKEMEDEKVPTSISTETKDNEREEDEEGERRRIWTEYWTNVLLPLLLEGVGCKTDVVGICLTPLRRAPSSSTTTTSTKSSLPVETDATSATDNADESSTLKASSSSDRTTTSNSNREVWHPKEGQSFTCTGLIARGWAGGGIDLFDGVEVGLDGLYPNDFIKSPYFYLKS